MAHVERRDNSNGESGLPFMTISLGALFILFTCRMRAVDPPSRSKRKTPPLSVTSASNSPGGSRGLAAGRRIAGSCRAGKPIAFSASSGSFSIPGGTFIPGGGTNAGVTTTLYRPGASPRRPFHRTLKLPATPVASLPGVWSLFPALGMNAGLGIAQAACPPGDRPLDRDELDPGAGSATGRRGPGPVSRPLEIRLMRGHSLPKGRAAAGGTPRSQKLLASTTSPPAIVAKAHHGVDTDGPLDEPCAPVPHRTFTPPGWKLREVAREWEHHGRRRSASRPSGRRSWPG